MLSHAVYSCGLCIVLTALCTFMCHGVIRAISYGVIDVVWCWIARTNGAQFAVAMKFLHVSLRALGIAGASNGKSGGGGSGFEASSRLLMSLMEMYGEMGDRIALQYGGSEAHKKVSFPPIYY